jgi:hypothetical protein
MSDDVTFFWYWLMANSEDVRNLGLAFTLFLAPLYLVWRAWLGHRDELRTRARAVSDQQSRDADRLSKTFAQLGNDQVAVRIAAIHMLEQVARDNPRQHGPIMQTLGAFIREQARAPVGKLVGSRYEPPEPAAIYAPPRTDVQAALTVVGRRKRDHDRPMDRPMLVGVNLSGYDLSDGDFTEANFRGSYLCGAAFAGARLTSANFDQTLLENADLYGADCMGASFSAAAAPGARFAHARLDGARMAGADLRAADFTRARLDGADLDGAYYDDAIFDNATGPDGLPMIAVPELPLPALSFRSTRARA